MDDRATKNTKNAIGEAIYECNKIKFQGFEL